MGPESYVFHNWWIMPMIFCFFMMIAMFFVIGRRRMMGPGRFFNMEESNSRKSTESALDILNKRYAKGEISKSEYDEMKSALMR